MWTVLPLFIFVFASLNEAVLEAPLFLQRIDEKVFGEDGADIFVARVQVGNPASAFNLTLDLAYSESLLIGKGSTSETCSNTGHIGFDTSRSTTFRRTAPKPYTATVEAFMIGRYCGVVLDATVIAGTDDFLGSKQVPFGVISQYKGAWSPDWPSDGLLGLFGPANQFPGQPSTANTLASNNGAAVVSWYINEKRNVGERSGSIAFGGLPAVCSGLNYVTPYFTIKQKGWNFRVNGASLGGIQHMNIGGKGFFDFTSSTLLQLPLEVFSDFMTEIHAEKDQATGLYYVNCDSAIILPNLTVQLDGVKLTLPYHAYVDLATPKPKCQVLLRSLGDGLFWTFGNRLWASYCVALNYDTGYVGFSLLTN
ncbi:gastricsin-like protein [Aphelenchoides avenae]|nr:gastricsin-like protein [Aphelenchus avenae]